MKPAIVALRQQLNLDTQALGSQIAPLVSYVSTACEPLDAVLPGGGLPLGSFVEILSAQDGSGAFSLALKMARKAIEAKGNWIVLDTDGSFYPLGSPGALALHCGLDVRKLVLIRTQPKHAPWVFNQLLRCPEAGACFFNASRLESMACRRFQLAAERGGGLGFLLRNTDSIRKPCWGALRLLVKRAAPATHQMTRNRLQVTVLKVRGSHAVNEPLEIAV